MLTDNHRKILTIIPAKISSSRLKRKNILNLAGKPLIAHTIEIALASGSCGQVMVSTESSEVAEIAIDYGASVPFLRPAYLSHDPYGVVDVCLHVLDRYEEMGERFETLIILLPTSPLRSVLDIRESCRIFYENQARFLMSVSEFDHNVFGALVQKDGEPVMRACFPEYLGKKRHEVPRTYRANGAVCIVDVKEFRIQKSYYGDPLYAYFMPWERSIDIDTERDLRFAEFLMVQKGDIHGKV